MVSNRSLLSKRVNPFAEGRGDWDISSLLNVDILSKPEEQSMSGVDLFRSVEFSKYVNKQALFLNLSRLRMSTITPISVFSFVMLPSASCFAFLQISIVF